MDNEINIWVGDGSDGDLGTVYQVSREIEKGVYQTVSLQYNQIPIDENPSNTPGINLTTIDCKTAELQQKMWDLYVFTIKEEAKNRQEKINHG